MMKKEQLWDAVLTIISSEKTDDGESYASSQVWKFDVEDPKAFERVFNNVAPLPRGKSIEALLVISCSTETAPYSMVFHRSFNESPEEVIRALAQQSVHHDRLTTMTTQVLCPSCNEVVDI